MRPITKVGVLLVAMLAPAGLAAQERLDRRIPIASDASIRILNLAGSIRVTGWNKDTLAVRGILPGGAGKFFYMGGKGRVAKLGVDLPESDNREQSADLEVFVPVRAKVWVKAATADIQISDFSGGLDLYSVSGVIRVRGTPQQVSAESMDGAVDLVVTTPFARVKTASGNITLSGSAEDVSATTVGGTVEVRDQGFQRARFESVTGNITYTGPVPKGSSLTLESHSGSIEVTVPAATEAEIDVNSFQGEIRNDLSSVKPAPVRERGGRELSFTLGLGGADISIRNFKGNVVLKRR